MKFISLYAENIYSYENLEFRFDKYPGGTTLFLGKDLDKKGSNGAGKSSILKTLYFALYGEDYQGANYAEIKRRGSTKGMFVRLIFEDRGHSFRIERFDGRKDLGPTGKGVNFYVDDELFKGDGGVKETQSFIQNKIKMSPKLFLSSVLATPEAKTNFLLESDTQKKELLSELLDLQIYNKAFKYIKEEIGKIDDKNLEHERKITSYKEQIVNLEKEVKEAIPKSQTFLDEKNKELSELVRREKDLSLKIQKIEAPQKKHDLEGIKAKIDSITAKIEELDKKLENESKVSTLILQFEMAIKDVKSKSASALSDIEEFQKRIEDLDSTKVDPKELDALLMKKDELDKAVAQLDSLTQDFNKLSLEKNTLENKIKNAKESIQDKDEKIKELENSENCPTCLRPLDDNGHLSHIKKAIEKAKEDRDFAFMQKNQLIQDLHKVEQNHKELTLEIQELEHSRTELGSLMIEVNEFKLKLEKQSLKEAEKTRLDSKITEARELIAANDPKEADYEEKLGRVKKVSLELADAKKEKATRQVELNKVNQEFISATVEENEYNQLLKSKDDLKRDLLDQQYRIKELKTKENPYKEIILSQERRIEGLLLEIKKYEELIHKNDEELKYLKFWEVGFAPTGIRSFITDDVIDLLNQKTQDNLNDLYDGIMNVLFDPESKNNKGAVSNKISTNIFANGRATSFEALSSGEKGAIVLAVQLALTEVAESRSGNKLNIRFMDEPFTNMDSTRQIKAFKLFSRFAKDRDGFFVISHDESFQNMSSNLIYILKKNEISRIVDKKTFDQYESPSEEAPMERDTLIPSGIEEEGKSKQELLAERLKKLSEKKN